MISYNFDYFQPNTIQEAMDLFQTLQEQQKDPVYFSVGTEMITLGRVNKMTAAAVIDLKHIPKCHTFEEENQQLTIESALTFTNKRNMKKYPLLEDVISEIPDHTSRTKINLGDDICAKIIYREAVLTILLPASHVVNAPQ